MAKVTAPLFSFGARGKLADAIVYFPWKGVDAVRSYVVPANPNTASQATQRTRMTDAVAEWHGSTFIVADVSAWNRLANLLAKSLSGFNRMVQEFINEDVLGNVWERMWNYRLFASTTTSLNVRITKNAGGNSPTVRWGTSPTNMSNSATMVNTTGNTWDYDITGLTANNLYYITFDVGATGVDWGRLGIYTERTPAS